MESSKKNVIKNKTDLLEEITNTKTTNYKLLLQLVELNKIPFKSIFNSIYTDNSILLKKVLLYYIYYNSLNLLQKEEKQFYLDTYENFNNNYYDCFFSVKCNFNKSNFDIYKFSYSNNLINPIIINLYNLEENIVAREKSIELIEKKLNDLNKNKSTSIYLESELKDLKSRTKSLPLNIIAKSAYQNYFKKKFYYLFGINQNELNNPFKVTNESNDYIQTYTDNELFNYKTNRGKTLVKKYPDKNPIIIIKNNIEYY